MKTELPDNVFPRHLDPNNTLTTRYVTTTLFPQPGPKSAKSCVDAVSNFLEYLEKYQASIIDILSTPRFHDIWKEFYKTLPSIFDKKPDPVSQRKPELWQNRDIWQSTFNDLSGFFNPQERSGEAIGVIRKQQVRSFASLDKVMQNRRMFRQNMSMASNVTMAASRFSVIRDKSLFFEAINEVEGVFEKLENNQQVAQDEINKAQSTLSKLETNYRIMEFLMHGGWLGDALLGAKKIAMTEKTFISPTIFSNNALKLLPVLSLVTQNLPRKISASEFLPSENPVKTILENRYKTYRKNSIADQLLNQPDVMAHFVTILYNRHRDLSAWFGANSSEQPDLNDYLSKDAQREWAFLRHEKLELKLGEPKLRGPVHAESLPPLSSITIKDEASTIAEQVSTLYEATLTAQQLQSGMSSSSKLENIFEKSFYKESDYGDSEFMLKTSSELRRNRIDSFIDEMSKRNDRMLSEKFINSKNSQREYRSQGQDPDNAATELSFQVVTDVEAKISLEELNLVWCPRISKPFSLLQKQIEQSEVIAECEYFNENSTPKPIVPSNIDYIRTYKDSSVQYRHDWLLFGDIYRAEVIFDIPIELFNYEIVKDESCCIVDVSYLQLVVDDEGIQRIPGLASNLYRFDKIYINYKDRSTIKAWISIPDINDYFWQNLYDRLPIVMAEPPNIIFRFRFQFKTPTEESKSAIAKYEEQHWNWIQEDAAVKGRSKQYSRLRRNEAISLFNNDQRQKELAFHHLIDYMFEEKYRSMFCEILRTCFDWEVAHVLFEYSRPINEELLFPTLPPDHILNARAVRLILPIKKESEAAFFEVMEAVTEKIVTKNSNKVSQYIEKYREHIKAFENQLILDAYKTEMVIGRHCEAVLSKSSFIE